MRRQAFIDIDGVLGNFVKKAHEIHQRPYAEVTDWNFFRSWGLSDSAFFAPMGRDYWATIEPYDHAEQLVSRVVVAFGVENTHLLTSPCDTDGCLEGKRDWVKRHFPQLLRRLHLSQSKGSLGAPGKLLIDDSDANCDSWAAHGGSTILWPQPWNKSEKAAESSNPSILYRYTESEAHTWTLFSSALLLTQPPQRLPASASASASPK